MIYYDGWRVLTETDAAGAPNRLRDYVYGNYLDEVLLMNDGTDDHYYAHDHLFSVAALLDDTAAVEEYYEYDAYGTVTVHTDDGVDDTWLTADDTTANVSAQGNPFTFTGQRLDSLDTDALLIMYYKNRYYLTTLGRFAQRDPLGVNDGLCLFEFTMTGAPESPRPFLTLLQYQDGASLYVYVRNCPVDSLDSLGCFGNEVHYNDVFNLVGKS